MAHEHVLCVAEADACVACWSPLALADKLCDFNFVYLHIGFVSAHVLDLVVVCCELWEAGGERPAAAVMTIDGRCRAHVLSFPLVCVVVELVQNLINVLLPLSHFVIF